MDDRSDQVGWTEAQWNRVREEVLRAWQRVRVAGSFLSVDSSLPASTQVVPSEVINPDGTVDDTGTAALLEIALPVTLTRQQVREEDLSSALLQFRRRATQVGQLEDWYIFNGTSPRGGLPVVAQPSRGGDAAPPRFRPNYFFLDSAEQAPSMRGIPDPMATAATQVTGLLLRNPGALGLIEGPRAAQERRRGVEERESVPPLDNDVLMKAVVNAINSLERFGYVAPYVCVFGRRPFQAAHQPIGNGSALPRDRLEPLIGRELQHASAIDVPPVRFRDYSPPSAEEWGSRAVLLSLAGDAVDLAIAAEATPEFRQVDAQGRYIFTVFERFALRIKDLDAIAPLTFNEPSRRIWSKGERGAAPPPPPTPPRRFSLGDRLRRLPRRLRAQRPRRASG